MSETHTPHHDAPKISSWAQSGTVSKPQTGYIVASLAWVGIPLCDSFLQKLDLTLTTLTLTLTLTLTFKILLTRTITLTIPG